LEENASQYVRDQTAMNRPLIEHWQKYIVFWTTCTELRALKRHSDPKHLLFPISKDATDVNPGLTQNPGY